MNIRKAGIKDSKQIKNLAESLRLNSQTPKEKGFLIYVLDEEEYKKHIQESKYFFIAQEKKEIIGFVMAYDDKSLKSLFNENQMKHEDNLVKFILEQNNPFIFGDQIGIRSNNEGNGIGKRLMRNYLQRWNKIILIPCILQSHISQ